MRLRPLSRPCGCRRCPLQVLVRLERTYHPSCAHRSAIISARQRATNRARWLTKQANGESDPVEDLTAEEIEVRYQQALALIRYQRKVAA